MPITKRPHSNQNDSSKQHEEQAATAFIAGANKAAPVVEEDEGKRQPVMLRFDPQLLKRVDEAAKRRGISRSAWIQFTVSRALDIGEG